jgi:hypothetical protein
MYNAEVLKEKIQGMANLMRAQQRGELDAKIEFSVVSELESIYMTMADRFNTDKPNVHGLAGKAAMVDLIERMELDFSQKFAMDLRHGIDKNIEIGKIKIAFLDGVRRALNSAGAAA